MTARPQRRRGRLCLLRSLDKQRPAVPLERMKRDRRPGFQMEPLVFWFCVVAMVAVSIVALAMKGCA